MSKKLQTERGPSPRLCWSSSQTHADRRARRLHNRRDSWLAQPARGAACRQRRRNRASTSYWLMQAHPDWDVVNCGVNGERSDQIAARFARDVVAARAACRDHHRRRQRCLSGLPGRCGHAKLKLMYELRQGRRHHGARRHDRSVQHGDARTEPPHARDQRMDRAGGAARSKRGVRGYPAGSRRAEDLDRLISSPDSLHPSVDGYRRMADAMRPVLERLL